MLLTIELAVLLYVDSVFGVGKFALDCADYKALCLSFGEEVVKLYKEECELAASGSERLTDCVSKRQGIISVLLLLEIFERTNFQTQRTQIKRRGMPCRKSLE